MTATTEQLPRTAPPRVLVGRFSRYADAKRAVDSLRVARVPERRITVNGRELRWHSALTAERAATIGSGVGAAIAALSFLAVWAFGGLAADFTWLTAVFLGGVLGGVAGLIAGLLLWRFTRDVAGLPESGHVDVGRYEVLVEEQDAETARDLLGD
jgi:hypothetical protein